MIDDRSPNKDPFDSGSEVFSDAVDFANNMPISEYFSANETSEDGLVTNMSSVDVGNLELWDSNDVFTANSRLNDLISEIESQSVGSEECQQSPLENGRKIDSSNAIGNEMETALESPGIFEFQKSETSPCIKDPRTQSPNELSAIEYFENASSSIDPRTSISLSLEKDIEGSQQMETSETVKDKSNKLAGDTPLSELPAEEDYDLPNNSMSSFHRNKSIVKVISSMQGMFKKRELVSISRHRTPTQMISLTVPRGLLQNECKSKKDSLRKWKSYMGLNQKKKEANIHDASEIKRQLIKTISEGSLSMKTSTNDNLVEFCIIPVSRIH